MVDMEAAVSGHQRLDLRSLELHRAIAAKLRQQPGLLSIARDNLARWASSAGRSQPYLDIWQKLIDGPFEELLAIMISDEERVIALRQASPFAGILKPAERWAIYRRFERPSQ